MKTTIILARHGRTEKNFNGFFQPVDEPLNEIGFEQARLLAERLKKVDLDVIYSSTFLRAKQTAETVAQGEDIIFDDLLVERRNGKLAGMNGEEVEKAYPGFFELKKNPDHVYPGGESTNQAVSRSHEFIKKLLKKSVGKTVLLVTHGVIIRGLLNYFFGVDIVDAFRIRLYNTGLSVIEVEDGEGHLIMLNDASHLGDTMFYKLGVFKS